MMRFATNPAAPSSTIPVLPPGLYGAVSKIWRLLAISGRKRSESVNSVKNVASNRSVSSTPPLLPSAAERNPLDPALRLPPPSNKPDSEKHPRSATTPVTKTALMGEWKRSLTFASGAGSTLSKDIAKRILDAVRMKGGMSLAIQKTPKMTRIQLAEPRLIPLALRPASVVVHSLAVGKSALPRVTPGTLL